MPATPETLQALNSRFGDVSPSEFRGQTRVILEAAKLDEALDLLHGELGFDMLVDITCVDYLVSRVEKPGRFGLVYQFLNTETSERLTARVFLDEPDLTVPSATRIWEGANWLEREVWDLFGIRFSGHPDLRRIVLPQEYTNHPLRKDYPLQGRGERHNFPVITRGQS
jgi:NADH-quinone oxidoreductase subunit C